MALTATRIARTTIEQPVPAKHEQGIQAFNEGRFNEAIRLFGEAVAEGESSEIWNDWAAAQLAIRNTADAERAFRRALKLQPDNHQAAANLGVLLAAQGRAEEASPLLERCQPGLGESERATVTRLLEQCQSTQAKPAANTIKPLGPLSRMMLALSAQTSAVNMMSLRLIALEETVDKLARAASSGTNGKK